MGTQVALPLTPMLPSMNMGLDSIAGHDKGEYEECLDKTHGYYIHWCLVKSGDGYVLKYCWCDAAKQPFSSSIVYGRLISHDTDIMAEISKLTDELTDLHMKPILRLFRPITSAMSTIKVVDTDV